MSETGFNFEDFLLTVDPKYQSFAQQTHEQMLQDGCALKMASAKSGYVVSYQHGKKKRVVMNFVFRKGGLVARIYGDNAGEYASFLESLPESMHKAIEKAPPCKRFEDPPRCSANCIGYVFPLNGKQHQKCRYNCFMFPVTEESIPHIKALAGKELEMRK